MKSYQLARPVGLLFLYSAALVLSLWTAYLLRFDFHPDDEYLQYFTLIALCLVGVKLLLLAAFRQFASLLSYFGMPDILRIFLAMLIAALIALIVWMRFGVAYAPPRAVILSDFIISFVAICGLRTGFRLLREGYFEKGTSSTPVRRIGIIGAGNVGASLIRELTHRRALGMEPAVLFDDDRTKWKTTLHGVPIHGAPEAIPAFLKKNPLDEIVIAMPGASSKRLRTVVRLLTEAGIRFATVPSLEQLVTGQVKVTQIRAVEIEDLLGREAVNLQTDRIRDLIHDRVVLVTGAGGSIGSELCRQIALHGPRQLVMLERSEFLLFQIEQELARTAPTAKILPLVADLLDEPRLQEIFSRHRPQVIFHAAAHKHVPMMEYQSGEAFRNNVLGTRNLARLAASHGTERFVLISTDKAINPTSVMGATKRVAELYLQALQAASATATKFMAVRFGNVLGSSGSVIPTFKRQIASGGPVTVTHPDVTRYFMTVNEAVGLVLQSATQGVGGEIFVLNMGEPVRIVDLARQLIELSGLRPDEDIELQFTGLRPGEKLFEELNHNTENIAPTTHPKIMRFMSNPRPLAQVETALDQIATILPTGQPIKAQLQLLVPEYNPYSASPG